MTWSGIGPQASRDDVLTALAVARETGADLIAAVGGGAVVKTGMLLPLLLAHDVRSAEDFDSLPADALPPSASIAPARTIVVPTTLSAGLDDGMPEAWDHCHGALPIAVILDPALTLHTPEWLWMANGMRAIGRAIGTLASLRPNAVHDGIAEDAIRLLAGGLRRVKADPADLEGRLACQTGAWRAAASGIPMSASQTLGRALVALYGVHPGHAACALSPAVLVWAAQRDAGRQTRIAAVLGESGASAAEALAALIASLELPGRLADLGVGEDKFPRIAEYSVGDIWLRANPCPIETQEDLLTILHLAA